MQDPTELNYDIISKLVCYQTETVSKFSKEIIGLIKDKLVACEFKFNCDKEKCN